jgi:phage terminase large subunit
MPKNSFLAPIQALQPYHPHPHQIWFHQCPAKYRAIVSGVGAGKTRTGVEEVRKINGLYPGSFGVIGRLTATSLRDTTQRRFFEVIEPSMIANYNKNEGHVWLYTGRYKDLEHRQPILSEVLFMHLDEPGQLGSLDLSWFMIDEAHEPDGQEVPEDVFRLLMARVGRHPVGPGRGWILTNSGGKDWIWKLFFSPGHDNSLFNGITVPTSANAAYLPPGYEAELRRTNPKTWCDRFLDASFEAFEGQIFPDFDEKIHVYNPGEIELKVQWQKGGGFDFGVSAPTCAEYGCVNMDGHVFIYDEDYTANADIRDMCKGIKHRGFEYLYADPSVVVRGPNKKSPKDFYSEEGVVLIPTSNDIDYFITLVTQLLRDKKLHISSRCKNLIHQIKQAAWSPTTLTGTSLKEMMKIMENHALDAFKYFINTFGLRHGVLDAYQPTESKILVPRSIHPSFAEDEDFYKPGYVHQDIKKRILNANQRIG